MRTTGRGTGNRDLSAQIISVGRQRNRNIQPNDRVDGDTGRGVQRVLQNTQGIPVQIRGAEIGHMRVSRQHPDIHAAQHKAVAGIGREIAFVDIRAADRRGPVFKPADRADHKAARIRDRAVRGLREAQQHLAGIARRQIARGQPHHIHVIAGLEARRGIDNAQMLLEVRQGGIGDDQPTIGIQRKRQFRNRQRLTAQSGGDKAHIFHRVRGREHFQVRVMPRRFGGGVPQRHGFRECSAPQHRIRHAADRYGRNRTIQNLGKCRARRVAERRRSLNLAHRRVENPRATQRRQTNRAAGRGHVGAGQRMQIGEQSLPTGAAADIAAPEHDIGIGRQMVGPPGDLAGVRGDARGVQRLAAEIGLPRFAIGQKMDRGHAGTVGQRVRHLIDGAFRRVNQHDLSIDRGAGDQRPPVRDARVDEDQFLGIRIGGNAGRIRRASIGRPRPAGDGLRRDTVFGHQTGIGMQGVRRLGGFVMRIHHGLRDRRNASVEQIARFQHQLHKPALQPRHTAHSRGSPVHADGTRTISTQSIAHNSIKVEMRESFSLKNTEISQICLIPWNKSVYLGIDVFRAVADRHIARDLSPHQGKHRSPQPCPRPLHRRQSGRP